MIVLKILNRCTIQQRLPDCSGNTFFKPLSKKGCNEKPGQKLKNALG
jgi:hypothetical protein